MKLWTYSIIEDNGDSIVDLVCSAVPDAAWKSPVRARDEAHAEVLSLFDVGLDDAKKTIVAGVNEHYYFESHDATVVIYSIELME